MRKAKVFVKGIEAVTLAELKQGKEYVFEYIDGYDGPEIDCTWILIDIDYFIRNMDARLVSDYCGCKNNQKKSISDSNTKLSEVL